MGMFGGGAGEGAVEAQQPAQQAAYAGTSVAPQCQEYSKMFVACMDRNGNEFGMCSDYMEMMKSCQSQFGASSS